MTDMYIDATDAGHDMYMMCAVFYMANQYVLQYFCNKNFLWCMCVRCDAMTHLCGDAIDVSMLIMLYCMVYAVHHMLYPVVHMQHIVGVYYAWYIWNNRIYIDGVHVFIISMSYSMEYTA